MSRDRTIYRETYRKGAVKLNQDVLPILQHKTQEGGSFRATACEVIAAGMVLIEGKEVEYQDLRVYFEVDP
jgi:hypothetical protein